ncbi:hypothetical protein F511_10648 [Dorcoceras hygrometricum]|uniref:Sphingomyelin phosphodiesterase 4 n=1 Tax=Dorcoceras hygrometricum TaxID=472368 RepID=A0A2Z7CGC3_9LAMI|nr:hypothetical protein F511_10648 [Dorcoceras hygrometricum]
MIPHSYVPHTQNKCAELASVVAAAVSPPQIIAACSAVESFLQKHNPGQQRWFFSVTFPTLICRLFGFDDSSPPSAPRRLSTNGWIDIASLENDSELTGKLLSLLSPNGVLLSSMHEVDRLSLVKYVFPVERLPDWFRYMLQRNSESSETVKVQRTRKFRLENWSTSIPGLSSAKRGTEKKNETNLYIQLLYIYLHSFVPVGKLNVHQPYYRSVLRCSTGYDNSATERAEFVVNTFIHFWLVDNDFSPLPVGLCKSSGVSFPFNSVLGETPPTAGLGDVLNVFVKYLNSISILVSKESDEIDYVGSPEWRVSSLVDVAKSSDPAPSVHSVGSWNLLIQRPLYRFILRTFLFCPVGTSIKNASQVFSLWVNHMEPWSINFEEFPDLDELSGVSNRTAKCLTRGTSHEYSSSWQGYVLANYLFYSSLVMHFIGFAHKFLHTDTEAIAQMVAKVINILTSSSELMDLLKNMDTVYHSKVTESSKLRLNKFNRFVPTIRQQLQDWEYGLCENNADGSFLHENWNRDLQLFAYGEDGGHHLLQLFVLRAESELQSVSGNNVVQSLQNLDSLKAQVNQLFGGPITKSSSGTLESRHCHQSCHEIFKPRVSGNQLGDDIRYKGDSMERPISDDEIAWLAKLLVNLSNWMNFCFGLNQVPVIEGGHGWSYVEVPSGLTSVDGPKETVKVVSFSLLSWITWLGESLVQFMRNHHYRINLRVLASKKVAVMVLIFAVFNLLKKTFTFR